MELYKLVSTCKSIIRKCCMYNFDLQFSLSSQSQLRMSHDSFYSRHLMVNYLYGFKKADKAYLIDGNKVCFVNELLIFET